MKTITSLSLAFLMLFTVTASAQDQEYDIMKGSTLVSMKGQTYIYEVDFYGTKYDFKVSLKENSIEKGLGFDYEMTNSNNTKGTVSISPGALKTAHAQNNYFSGGPMNLTDMTTVWMSKEVANELQNKGESKISTDGGATWIVLKRKYFNYDFAFLIQGEMRTDFGYMYCESEDGTAKYWIQTGGNPLIFKMDLGWSITLKEYIDAN